MELGDTLTKVREMLSQMLGIVIKSSFSATRWPMIYRNDI